MHLSYLRNLASWRIPARYRSRPLRPRHEIPLCYPTLDHLIAEHHPVRILDDILRALDWTDREAPYRRAFGRPPHPPQVLAGVLLYGLRRRARSRRQREYLVGPNVDFIWLAEGRTIDHATLRKFRTRFAQELRDQTKKRDKSCFRYDAERDCYGCPPGQPLEYEQTKREQRYGEQVALRVYRASACAGCPLAGTCVAATNQAGRTITRDGHAPERERLARKRTMAEARLRYWRRMAIGETPLGLLKAVRGLRQFLLRGLAKVQTEWLGGCTAVNVRKLVEAVGREGVAGKAAVAQAG